MKSTNAISFVQRQVTRARTCMPRIFQTAVRLALLAVLVFAFAQAPKALADSDTCLAKAASFVAELDDLLDKVKNHTAYTDFAERYFPFRDCEAEALLDIVRQSRFIRSIQHSPRTNAYHVLFENDFVGAWFSYLVVERKSLAAWRRIHP